eukprot:UN02143
MQCLALACPSLLYDTTPSEDTCPQCTSQQTSVDTCGQNFSCGDFDIECLMNHCEEQVEEAEECENEFCPIAGYDLAKYNQSIQQSSKGSTSISP